MNRRLRPMAIAVWIALVSTSGCASHWRDRQVPTGYTSMDPTVYNGDWIQQPGMGLSAASLNDWNFRHAGW